LRIRKEQMKVFEEVALRNFEDEMVQHIKQFTPKHSEIIGEKVVQQVVRTGMERAKKYGLTNRGPVRFYIEMMFMFGSDFDTDPQYPWTGEILNDSKIEDQMQRADRLYYKAMDYLEKAAGPENKYEKEALRRVTLEHLEDLPTSEDNDESEMFAYLNRLHPQKCEYIGKSALYALVKSGRELAQGHAVVNGAGPAVFVSLMFALGHGCSIDPQFPWIAGTLNNTFINDPSKKVDSLYLKMMTYFNNALALMEKG